MLDVPQEEIVVADYRTAESLWAWFYLITPPVDDGAPGITVDGLPLSRVTLPGVSTLDALRALLCEHVSGDVADEWLATGRFVESDGMLYAAWADRGSDDSIADETFRVTFSGNGGTLTQTITRRGWDSVSDSWVLTGETDHYDYPFTLADGHAVFTAFPCPY